jgi:hypothetical protein
MLQLLSIRFRGLPGGAIPLRRNERRGTAVFGPEWTPANLEPEHSPVAYIAGGSEIRVSIELKRLDTTSAAEFEVSTVDAAGGANLLGNLLPGAVAFQPGQSVKTIHLTASKTIDSRVACHDDCLDWSARHVATGTTIGLGRTRHRVYALLATPGMPWETALLKSNQWVWTAVLDLACKWAAGETTLDGAAGAITRELFALGDGGDERFTLDAEPSFADYPPFEFDCGAFLEAATHPRRGLVHVDCQACSSIVSTLANSLGCRLLQTRMAAFRRTLPARPIGRRIFEPRLVTRHQVAAERQGDDSFQVWDACFLLQDALSTGTVLAGFPYDAAGFEDYLGRLFYINDRPLDTFVDTQGREVNRAVMPGTGPVLPIPLRIVAELGEKAFDKFMSDEDPRSRLFLHRFFWTAADLPELQLLDTRNTDGAFPRADSLWSAPSDPDRPAVRAIIHEAASRDEARHIFAARLSEYSQPVEYVDGIGEVAFQDPERGYRVALAGNAVWTVIPKLDTGFNGSGVALAIDRWLQPPIRGVNPLVASPGIRVPLPADDLDRPVWYLLQPRNGVLSRDALGVVFSPTPGGEKSVVAKTHLSAHNAQTTTIPL